VISFDHTQTHTKVGRTPLDEGSARRRAPYLTTQTLTRQTSMSPGGIRTHDPSKRSAADLRLRPRGHWDRCVLYNSFKIFINQTSGEVLYQPITFQERDVSGSNTLYAILYS
jgi:hypothetical protein